MGISGVLLDVGGVFVVPDGLLVANALAAAGVAVGEADFVRAHYAGMASLDRGERYFHGYLDSVDVSPADWPRAMAALVTLAEAPLVTLWQQVITESVDALRQLASRGIPLGIVSNSDGTVQEQLRRHGICQIGAGTGTEVLAIVDSGTEGVEKPDARIFTRAVSALGLPADEIVFVGDSTNIDVRGAQSAGLQPIHLDPYRMCPSRHRHHHIQKLTELVDLVDGP